MNAKFRKRFMRVYIGIEMLSSIVLTILWVIYQVRHMFYGQALTYWICACMIALMTIGLMLPEFVKQRTKTLNNVAGKSINHTVKHLPMTIVLSFVLSVHASSDFGTVLATVSMSQVAKGMLLGILIGPAILEVMMLIITEIAQEDIINTCAEPVGYKTTH
mgnify:CR=1 FL=1